MNGALEIDISVPPIIRGCMSIFVGVESASDVSKYNPCLMPLAQINANLRSVHR